MLKQRLLNTGLFVDNEYLDKCIFLIEEGLSVGYIKYKTHKHHIIPRAYYRYNNLPVDNSDNNIENLLFKNRFDSNENKDTDDWIEITEDTNKAFNLIDLGKAEASFILKIG